MKEKEIEIIRAAIWQEIEEQSKFYCVDGQVLLSPGNCFLLAKKIADILEVARKPKTRIPKIIFSVEEAQKTAAEINAYLEVVVKTEVENYCESLLFEPGSAPAGAIKSVQQWALEQSQEKSEDVVAILRDLYHLQKCFELFSNPRAFSFPELKDRLQRTEFVSDLAKSDLNLWVEDGSLRWEAAGEEKSDRPTRKKKIAKKKVSRRIVLTKDE